MDTITEFPQRCDHPLEFVELLYATQTQSSGGAWSAQAIVKCHKCGAQFHMGSDYNGGYFRHNNEIVAFPQITRLPRPI
ncbi:MAG: hypothetical protein WCX79_01150 [Candidatus Paceibacterota bacterium]|jgi:hypothetical protein